MCALPNILVICNLTFSCLLALPNSSLKAWILSFLCLPFQIIFELNYKYLVKIKNNIHVTFEQCIRF